MNTTDRRLVAAQRLADALADFLSVCHEEAMRQKYKSELAAGFQSPKRVLAAGVDQPRNESGRQQPAPLLVDARKAAKLLCISERNLWSLSAPRGPIPVVRMGRLVRYSLDDLETVIKQFTDWK